MPRSAADKKFAEDLIPDARSVLESSIDEKNIDGGDDYPRPVNSSMQSEISRLDSRIAAIVSGISNSNNRMTIVTRLAAI